MQDSTKRKIVEVTGWIAFVIIFIISIPLMYLTAPKKGDVVVYNCSISEISPDFPIEVREQCRKLRADNILQKPK